MKRFTVVILSICCIGVALPQTINIIPKPNKLIAKDGAFTLSAATVILASEEENNSINFLNDYLKSYYGFTLKKVSTAPKNFIRISTKKTLLAGTEGRYDCMVNPVFITITGESLQGTFYGVQSLLQLLPPPKAVKAEIPISQKGKLSAKGKVPIVPKGQSSQAKGLTNIPCVEISDEPRFQYRGLMLDVSRHFFPVSFVKKYIDYIAMFKLNVFHWHLTDDQGWRIEIKKYPKLTSVGGIRNGTIVGHYPGTSNDNQPYSGFYTQEDVKEIVQYAKDRFVTVIPEIELPGHASAAIAAYPELSCFPNEATNLKANPSTASVQLQKDGTKKLVQETWGVFEDVFCPSDTTFHFLENVLDEVIPLFPSQYIHIGGDECPKDAWKKSTFCQKLIKEKKLKNENGLQAYFIQQIEQYVNAKAKKIIGWDEILEGGLAANATVMSWRGEQGGIDATKQGHDVIMTPNENVYFDHGQGEHEDSLTIGGYLPFSKVYNYDPIPAALSGDEAKHVLGAQANLWTEYIGNTSKVEYMLFPRLAALSEVLWTKLPYKDYKDFEKRLPNLFLKLDYMKTNYSKAFYELKATVSPSYNNDGVLWRISSKTPNSTFQVTTPANNTTQGDSVLVKIPGVYNATEIDNGNKTNISASQKFSINKATGKKINIGQIPSANYPGMGAFTLVDGIQNEKGMEAASEFIGFNGKDCDILLDFGKAETVNMATIHFYTANDAKMYAPRLAELWGSNDGMSYIDIAHTTVTDNSKPNSTMSFSITAKQKNFRYLKISVKNRSNNSAPNASWLLLDELEVN